MAKKNYYEILGVDKNASQDDIKKAYKKMAMKYHPDRMSGKSDSEKKEAEEKFKEINEANSVLSDEDKRRNYDQFGTADGAPDMSGWDPFGGGDPFGGFNPFGGGFGGGSGFFRERTPKGEDAEVVIQITQQEAYNGCKKDVTFKRNVRCSHCGGTGSEDGKRHECKNCGGTGYVSTRTQRGNTIIESRNVCPKCHGSGKEISNKCHKCGGTGLETINVTQKIEVPKGSFNGMAFGVRGEGHDSSSKNGMRGDLVVRVVVIADERFVIDKNNPCDVLQTIELNLYDALVGCEKVVECIDGSKVKISIPEMTRDGKVFNVRGKGMPHIQENYVGNMKVIVKYNLPKTLSARQKEILKEFCKI